MKRILICGLLVLGLFKNINCMLEESDQNLGFFEVLPNEIRYNIISLILENHINQWKVSKIDDIFNFDKKSLWDELNRINLICKNFNVFTKEEFKDLVKALKKERFLYLKGIVEDIIKEKYKDVPKITYAYI